MAHPSSPSDVNEGPQRRSGPPATTTPPQERPDPARWRALSVCLVAGFMTLMDISIVNVALPSISSGLQASTSDLQWILSGYALTFGLVLVPSGRLGDARGRRMMFVAGVALFTLSSLAAGLAPTALALVVARLVQGIGGGLLNPQINGLIQELFRGAERGKAFGLLGATIGVSTAIGPLLGGAIIRLLGTDTGWRWIFFVNLPIGIACILLTFRYVRVKPDEERHHEDLDPVGVVLLGLAVLAVLLPLVQERQWPGAGKWWLLLVGAVLLAIFVWWERRHADHGGAPLIDLRLFGIASYTAGSLIGLLYFSGFTSIFFILTLYLQLGLGYTALMAGLAVTPFAIGSAVAAGFGGRVVTRYGRPMVALGLVVVIVGLALTDAVVTLRGNDPSWWIEPPLLIAGLGSGLVISPNVTLTVSEVPVAQAGTAGGVLQTGQRIGTAAGIALIGSVFFSRLAGGHGDFAAATGLALRVTVALVAVALAAALVDVVSSRRKE